MDSHGETPIQLAKRRHLKKLLNLLETFAPPPSSPEPSFQMLPAPCLSGGASSSDAQPIITTDSPSVLGKRVRRSTPMLIRASHVGVADKLKPLPESPITPDEFDDELDWEAFTHKRMEHNKSKLAIQNANRKVVSRAETKSNQGGVPQTTVRTWRPR